MAIERLSFLIKQDLMIKASELTDRVSQLLREGKQDEAMAVMGEANAVMGKTKEVDTVTGDYISKLGDIGIEQPPVEFLQRAILPEVTSQAVYTGERAVPADERAAIPPAIPRITRMTLLDEEPVNIVAAPIEAATTILTAQPEAVPASESRMPVLDAPTSEAKIGLPMQKVELPPMGARQERRIDGDLGFREERIVYTAYAINPERTNYAQPTYTDIAAAAYSDLEGNQVNSIVQQRRSYLYTVVENISRKMRAIQKDPARTPRFLGNFLKWLNDQPEYEDLTVDELLKVAEREIPFQQLKTRLTAAEQPAASDSRDARATGANKTADTQSTGAGEARHDQADNKAEYKPGGWYDLTPLQEQIAHAYFALNTDKIDFLYTSPQAIAKVVYADVLGQIENRNEHRRRLLNRAGNVHQAAYQITNKIDRARNAKDGQVPLRVVELLDWIHEQPEYTHLTDEDIAAVLQRKMTFDQVREKAAVAGPSGDERATVEASETTEAIVAAPTQVTGEETHDLDETVSTDVIDRESGDGTAEDVIDSEPEAEREVNPELDQRDMLFVARTLKNTDPEELRALGIELHPDDLAELQTTIDRLSEDKEIVQTIAQAKPVLAQKLMAYAKDRQAVFMANIASEDAQYLLTLLVGVDSEDKIKNLLGITGEVKKKTS